MEKRKRLIKTAVITGVVLFIYYIFVCFTGVSIPCFFYKITGYKCPGCGITHMFMSIARLDLEAAFSSNQVLFFMLPFLGGLFMIKVIFLPKWLEVNSRIFNAIIWSCIVILIIFAVIRNI